MIQEAVSRVEINAWESFEILSKLYFRQKPSSHPLSLILIEIRSIVAPYQSTASYRFRSLVATHSVNFHVDCRAKIASKTRSIFELNMSRVDHQYFAASTKVSPSSTCLINTAVTNSVKRTVIVHASLF